MKGPLTYTPIHIGKEGIDWILVVEVVCNLLEFFSSLLL